MIHVKQLPNPFLRLRHILSLPRPEYQPHHNQQSTYYHKPKGILKSCADFVSNVLIVVDFIVPFFSIELGARYRAEGEENPATEDRDEYESHVSIAD